MRYLCLVFVGDAMGDALTAPQAQALDAAQRRFTEALAERGDVVAAATVPADAIGTTLRVPDGSIALASASSAEGGEALRGILLIEARDLNEAIRMVAEAPSARLGRIDVWPVQESDAN
jgi:hypothetical protein